MKHVSVFLWQGLPPSIKMKLPTKQQAYFEGLQDPHHHPRAITLTGREQGERDATKRDALRRGGR